MTARVLVVGAVNVDLVVAADRLPGPGETVVGAGVERHGGGKGANAAVAAARAGAVVRFCGAVGADETGAGALAELRAEGIDVADVDIRDGMTTGMALIVVDPKGENQIAVGAGANASVNPAAVRSAVERAAPWAEGILVSTEITPAAVAAAVESAAARGMRCVLNTAPVTAELADLLALGPVVTPNASELSDLHTLLGGVEGASVEAMAATVAARTGAPVVVTLGADGALVVDVGGDLTRIPAGIVPEVRDTTGAGDTFNGVFVTALAGGECILDASVRAVAAASLSVASVGARDGMPDAGSIAAVLALPHH